MKFFDLRLNSIFAGKRHKIFVKEITPNEKIKAGKVDKALSIRKQAKNQTFQALNQLRKERAERELSKVI